MFLTAAEAREIAGAEEYHLTFILKKVRAAAERNEYSVIIRDGPYDRWMYRLDPNTTAGKTIERLQNLGYTVSLFYEERQFVDAGLKIEW